MVTISDDHFFDLAVRTGLEPATPCVTGMYSNQLNYRTVSQQYIVLLLSNRCTLPFGAANIVLFDFYFQKFREIFILVF